MFSSVNFISPLSSYTEKPPSLNLWEIHILSQHWLSMDFIEESVFYRHVSDVNVGFSRVQWGGNSAVFLPTWVCFERTQGM
jgi:hypothetical protein